MISQLPFRVVANTAWYVSEQFQARKKDVSHYITCMWDIWDQWQKHTNNNTPTVLEIKKQQIPPRQLAFINEINFSSLLYLFYRKDKCSWKPTTISYLFVVSLFVSGH